MLRPQRAAAPKHFPCDSVTSSGEQSGDGADSDSDSAAAVATPAPSASHLQTEGGEAEIQREMQCAAPPGRASAASDLAPLAEPVPLPGANDGTKMGYAAGAPGALPPPLPPRAASPAAADGSAAAASGARPQGAAFPALPSPATEGPTGGAGKQGTTRDLRKLTLPELKAELCALGFDSVAVAATERWPLVRQLQAACNVQVERLGSNAPQKLRDWARPPRKPSRKPFRRWSAEEDAVLLGHVAAARRSAAHNKPPNMRAAYDATVAELGAGSGRTRWACRTRWSKELKKKPEHAALARLGARRPGAESDEDDDDDDEDEDEEDEPDDDVEDSQMSDGGAAAPALSFKADAEGQPDGGSDADSPIAAGGVAASAQTHGAAMLGSLLAAAAKATGGVDGDDAAPMVATFVDRQQPAALRCADAPPPKQSPQKAVLPLCDRIRALERHLQESRARAVAIEGEYRRKKAAEEVVERRLQQQLHAARAEEQEEQQRDDAQLARLREEEDAEARAAEAAEAQAAQLVAAAAARRASAAAKAKAAQEFAAQVDKKRKREE